MMPEAIMPRTTTVKKAIGLIELRSIARGMKTTDAILKAANVELLRSHVVCPGKYIILVAGKISQVRSAIAVGEQVAPEVVVDHFILPNVHLLLQIWCFSARDFYRSKINIWW